MESVGSGDSVTTVVAMENSVHKTKRNHMSGNSAHVYLNHNSSPYDLFNLIMSEDFRSGIFQEWTNMRSATEGAVRKGDQDIKKYP